MFDLAVKVVTYGQLVAWVVSLVWWVAKMIRDRKLEPLMSLSNRLIGYGIVAGLIVSSVSLYYNLNPRSVSGQTAPTVQNQPPVVMTSWFATIDKATQKAQSVTAVIAPTTLYSQYGDSYEVLVIVRVQDDTVNEHSDTFIDKSNPFQIENVQIQVPLGPQSVARLARGLTLIDLYLAIIPKSADVSEISTLNSVTTHGGYILSLNAIGVPPPDVKPPVRTAVPSALYIQDSGFGLA